MLSLRYTRNLFLRAFCIVYLSAFLSYYIQIPGLYGDNGVTPARAVLENSKHETLLAKVHYQPTLLWLAPYVGLDTSYALDVLALFGAFLAFTGFVSQKLCTLPLFTALWSLYFSLYQVGQVFVSSGFDEFLLEAGFLAVLVAPLLPGRRKGSRGNSPSDAITFWLVRWLLFRYLFTTGLSKLISGSPKWWSLSALFSHFEAMPLPNPLSWYAHQIPHWILKLVSVYVNACELFIPFLFFVPIRSVRITSFVFQIFLQICITLTGNWDFSNILIVTLLLSLLDDQFFYGKKRSSTVRTLVGLVLNVLIYAGLFYVIYKLYSLRITGTQIDANIAFTRTNLDESLGQILTYSSHFGLLALGGTVLYSLSVVLFDYQGGNKVLAFATTVLYGLLAVAIFLSSTVPLMSLHRASNSTVNPTLRVSYNRLHKIHAINQYDLGSKLTVNGENRNEIVLEYADNIEGPWKEFNFLYKPGNVNHTLSFVAPYSPKLDWQMFWAAYSPYDKEPWLLSFTHRLLIRRPEVLRLLDKSHQSQNPPKYVRGVLYKYKYTSLNQKSASWWTREKVREYFQAFTAESPALIDFLQARNLLPVKSKQTVNELWKKILDSIRYVTNHLEATFLFWSVITAGLALICTSGGNNRK